MTSAELENLSAILTRGGATKPAWLDRALQKQSDRIASFRSAESKAPARTPLRQQLARFRDAVGDLKEGLHDPLLMHFIGHDRSQLDVHDRQLEQAMEHLSTLAHQAWLRLSEKPKLPQAFVLDDEEAVSAQLLCAWSAMHVLEIIYGRVFGANYPQVAEAANALWKASGGVPLGKPGDASGWSHHIQAAKAADRGEDRRAAWLAHELMMLQVLPAPEQV